MPFGVVTAKFDNTLRVRMGPSSVMSQVSLPLTGADVKLGDVVSLNKYQDKWFTQNIMRSAGPAGRTVKIPAPVHEMLSPMHTDSAWTDDEEELDLMAYSGSKWHPMSMEELGIGGGTVFKRLFSLLMFGGFPIGLNVTAGMNLSGSDIYLTTVAVYGNDELLINLGGLGSYYISSGGDTGLAIELTSGSSITMLLTEPGPALSWFGFTLAFSAILPPAGP
jgi:hypothetical protein